MIKTVERFSIACITTTDGDTYYRFGKGNYLKEYGCSLECEFDEETIKELEKQIQERYGYLDE